MKERVHKNIMMSISFGYHLDYKEKKRLESVVFSFLKMAIFFK
jgi:hypothetical protein